MRSGIGSVARTPRRGAGAIGATARGALAAVGLVLVAYLLRDAGPARVAHVLWEAGSLLPFIVALELWQMASDFVSLRVILGERRRSVPAATWVRSSAVAYAMMVLLPAGRAAGEFTRAALLSAHLGGPRAATASTQLQAAYLAANGLLSGVELVFVAAFFGFGSPLALLLAGNVVFQAIISAGLLAVLWDARVGRWLGRLRRRFRPDAAESPPLDPAFRRQVPWRAFLVCAVSRSAQLLQYGIVLYAVGGALSARGAVVTHGIHLVGATLGDLLPNQLGVVDGAYRAFAADLGFASAPARALSIAFVARISQLMVASACLVTLALTRSARRTESPAGAAPASVGADARS